MLSRQRFMMRLSVISIFFAFTTCAGTLPSSIDGGTQIATLWTFKLSNSLQAHDLVARRPPVCEDATPPMQWCGRACCLPTQSCGANGLCSRGREPVDTTPLPTLLNFYLTNTQAGSPKPRIHGKGFTPGGQVLITKSKSHPSGQPIEQCLWRRQFTVPANGEFQFPDIGTLCVGGDKYNIAFDAVDLTTGRRGVRGWLKSCGPDWTMNCELKYGIPT